MRIDFLFLFFKLKKSKFKYIKVSILNQKLNLDSEIYLNNLTSELI